MPRTDPPISAETVSLLMNDTVSILGADKLITPDDLRGTYDSLRRALDELGPEQFWPDVDTVRGKVLIIAAGEVLTVCCSECPVLTRGLFTVPELRPDAYLCIHAHDR